MNNCPFIVTIDTEGDNLWSNTDTVETKNSKFLFRFQSLCEKYNLKPTYLINWEIINCNIFKKLGIYIVTNGLGEIGMHLHAWNSPPDVQNKNKKFITQYPIDIIEKKVEVITKKIEDKFQIKVKSHRAGRWAMNDLYFNVLKKFEYLIDCSLTPYINWRILDSQYDHEKIDYSKVTNGSYFVGKSIFEKGNSDFLEVPVTIIKSEKNIINQKLCDKYFTYDRIYSKFKSNKIWLRPNGKNLCDLKYLVDYAIRCNLNYIEFILHSSELMPGGSPTFKTKDAIESLYRDLEELFIYTSGKFKGCTLTEYYNKDAKEKKYMRNNNIS